MIISYSKNVKGITCAIEKQVLYKYGENNGTYCTVFTEEKQESYLCGRLADFKYYNMDQALEKALELSEQLIRNN